MGRYVFVTQVDQELCSRMSPFRALAICTSMMA